MCDYCGCRSRPLVARLGREHDQITSLSRAIRRALEEGDTETAAATLAELAVVLVPHSAVEEAGLYPELTAEGIAGDTIYADHAAVDDAISAAATGAPGAWEAVPPALERLERHIHMEDYDLFPAAHQLLSDAAWDRIGDGPA